MDILALYAVAGISGLIFAFAPESLLVFGLVIYAIAYRLNNKQKVLAVIIYHAAVLLPLYMAVWDYSGSATDSIASYFVVLSLNSVVLGVGLCADRKYRALSVILAIIVLSVPPLASYSVISPIPVAGLLFPGFGLVGIILLLLVIGCLTVGRYETSLSTLLIASVAAHTVSASNSVGNIEGINTHDGIESEVEAAVKFEMNRYWQLELADRVDANTVVFPEGAFGSWAEESKDIMKLLSKRVLGGTRLSIDESNYVNALIDAGTGDVIYTQQNPIPIKIGERQQAITTNTIETTGEFATLICNEITNVWLSVHTFRTSKQEVIWVANLGWTDREYLQKRVIVNANLWAKLFSKNLIKAVNRHG